MGQGASYAPLLALCWWMGSLWACGNKLNPPSTSIWPGLYISCSPGPQWTSAPSRAHLSRDSSCSLEPNGQRRCFYLRFSFHFYFALRSRPSVIKMLVTLSSAMLYFLFVCSVKGCVHTWQVELVWPISEMRCINSQTPWLCSFSCNCFLFWILLMRWNVLHDVSFMIVLISSIPWELLNRHQCLKPSPWLWKQMIQPSRQWHTVKNLALPPQHCCIIIWKTVSAQNQIVTFGNQMLSVLMKVVKSRKVNSCGIKLHRDLIKRVDCANVYPAPPPLQLPA